MKPQSTEQTVSQLDTYEQGRIDAEADHAAGILLDRIERAQAFRLCRGRQLRPNMLTRLGMANLIAVN